MAFSSISLKNYLNLTFWTSFRLEEALFFSCLWNQSINYSFSIRLLPPHENLGFPPLDGPVWRAFGPMWRACGGKPTVFCSKFPFFGWYWHQKIHLAPLGIDINPTWQSSILKPFLEFFLKQLSFWVENAWYWTSFSFKNALFSSTSLGKWHFLVKKCHFEAVLKKFRVYRDLCFFLFYVYNILFLFY